MVIAAPRETDQRLITVTGNNQGEKVTFWENDFIMARSQSNYVDLCILREGGGLEKHMLRTTLSEVVEQIPAAQQIHRSYLVNVAYIIDLQGNSRKGSILLEHVNTPVPVSPKHFSGLKEYLQFRPKSSFTGEE